MTTTALASFALMVFGMGWLTAWTLRGWIAKKQLADITSACLELEARIATLEAYDQDHQDEYYGTETDLRRQIMSDLETSVGVFSPRPSFHHTPVHWTGTYLKATLAKSKEQEEKKP